MFVKDLSPKEYAAYHKTYLALASELSLLDALETNRKETLDFYDSISEATMNTAYAQGKWTIKELLQHVIDTERIFSYRALRFARNDKTNLPGYEQDDYIAPSKANEKTKEFLIHDFDLVRQNTISLFKSFTQEDLLKIGLASNLNISVRSIGFLNVGHNNHHINVVKNRYL